MGSNVTFCLTLVAVSKREYAVPSFRVLDAATIYCRRVMDIGTERLSAVQQAHAV